MGLVWLSFEDPKRPCGSQFLGAAIVRARSVIEAVGVAHALGCNPGGRVVGHPVEYADGIDPIPPEYIERLLTRDEVDSLVRACGGDPNDRVSLED